jgi:single-strand DNA-binding protein
MITAIVTGNLTKDPILRTTQSGKAMATFGIASNTKSGEDKVTTFVDMVCFDEQADVVAARLHKGDRIVATGRLQLETYQKNDGTEGRSLRMIAEDVAISMRYAEKSAVGAGAGDEPF